MGKYRGSFDADDLKAFAKLQDYALENMLWFDIHGGDTDIDLELKGAGEEEYYRARKCGLAYCIESVIEQAEAHCRALREKNQETNKAFREKHGIPEE